MTANQQEFGVYRRNWNSGGTFSQSRQIFHAVAWFDCSCSGLDCTWMSSSGQILVMRAETGSVTGEWPVVASWAHLVLLFHMHPQCRGLISALKYSWRAATERKLGQLSADLTLPTHYTASARSAEHHSPQISCRQLSFSLLISPVPKFPKVIFDPLVLFFIYLLRSTSPSSWVLFLALTHGHTRL